MSSQTRNVTSLSSSQSCTMLSQTIINPFPTHPSDYQTSTSSPSFPSRGKFSERIITRDLNSLRQDVRTIKAEINSLRRQSTPATPGEFQLEACRELKVLQQELAHLRESMYTRHAECQNQNQIQNLPSTQPKPQSPTDTYQQSSVVDSISITTWNCRGLANSLPYINHLIETGSDIIAITEHWLWPYNLNKLEEIHPGYTGFGCADTRLNESSV